MKGLTMDKDAGVAWLSLCDLSNDGAIDGEFCLQISRLATILKAERRLKVLILTGSSELFCSGATEPFLHGLIDHYRENIEHDYAQQLKCFLDIPIPVIAAMEGSATGGGLALGLYADMIVAAEESRYGLPFMTMGFTPGMGVTAMSREAFGYHLGFEMMVTGGHPRGRDLRGKCGFNYIVPRAAVLGKALELALAIAEKPREALELLKKYMSIERRKALEESSTVEAFMHRISFNRPGIDACIRGHFEDET